MKGSPGTETYFLISIAEPSAQFPGAALGHDPQERYFS